MKNREPQNPLRSWIDQLQARLRGTTASTPTGRPRRVSRREREARQRRMLYWGIGVAGGLALLILAGFALTEYVVTPRHVVAQVGGTKIRRADYWRVRSFDLLNQATQYQQFSMFAQDASQQRQYQALAQQALTQLPNVWGSTSIDNATLSRMIDDQVYVHGMQSLGLSVSQQEIDDFILQEFEPSDSPIFTPTPSPTLIPERAAWATETAAALGTPVVIASPTAATEDATPIAASPVAGSSEQASPVTTPILPPTPDQEQAIQTAEAGYKQYQDQVLSQTHMSRADYERLILRPAVARQKVRDVINDEVGQSAEQVHAAHILVATEDLANSIYEQVTAPGADFAAIAEQQSTDTATAANGGDLGWFARGTMVKEFDEVAFSLGPDEISKPFKTQFGWHIVKVITHEQNRPLTDEQIAQLQQVKLQTWLDQQRSELKISSDLKLTPTAVSEQFVPPPDAPQLPTSTEPEAGSENGTPNSVSPEGTAALGTPVNGILATPSGTAQP